MKTLFGYNSKTTIGVFDSIYFAEKYLYIVFDKDFTKILRYRVKEDIEIYYEGNTLRLHKKSFNAYIINTPDMYIETLSLEDFVSTLATKKVKSRNDIIKVITISEGGHVSFITTKDRCKKYLTFKFLLYLHKDYSLLMNPVYRRIIYKKN